MNRNKISVAFLSIMTLSGLLSGAYAQSGVMVLPEQPLPATGTLHATTVVPVAHPMPTPVAKPRVLGHVTHVQMMPTATSATVTDPFAATGNANAPVPVIPAMYSMSGFVPRPVSVQSVNSLGSAGAAPAPHPTFRTYSVTPSTTK